MKKMVRSLLILLCVIILLAATVPFIIPVPELTGTRSIEELADYNSQFVDVNGIKVHYKMTGSGDLYFILLHGFGASTYSWRNIMEQLGKYGTVVAFDRPAFGLTARPLEWEGQNPYSPEAQTDLLIDFMDQLGIEQAILVGNSAGGTLAVYTTLRYSMRVSGLVLVDAAIYSNGGAPGWVKPLLKTPQMRHLGPLIARNLLKRGEDLVRQAWHDPSQVTPEILEGYSKFTQIENWDRALWELTLASRDLKLSERLDEVRLPVLVITGDDDRIVPTEQSLRLAEELPAASLVVIPNCGHVPQEECPGPFLQALVDFVARLRIPY